MALLIEARRSARRRAWRLRASMVLAAAACGWLLVAPVSGCSALLDGELGLVACQQEGAYGPPACPAGQSCVGGACASLGAPLGAACGGDAACAAGSFCLEQLGAAGDGGGWCTRPCCSSADCGAPERGLVCAASAGDAGSLCWPAGQVGLSPPGAARVGSSCHVDGDCRSAWCDVGRCADRCCSDVSCGGALPLCGVRPSPPGATASWACAPPSPGAGFAPCSEDGSCRTGACLAVAPAVGLCAMPCCGSRECGELLVDGELLHLACAPAPPDGLAACSSILPASADGAVGAPCEADQDCRGGLCLTDAHGWRYCSDTCCSDAACGDPQLFACRPLDTAGHSALRCLRK